MAHLKGTVAEFCGECSVLTRSRVSAVLLSFTEPSAEFDFVA